MQKENTYMANIHDLECRANYHQLNCLIEYQVGRGFRKVWRLSLYNVIRFQSRLYDNQLRCQSSR